MRTRNFSFSAGLVSGEAWTYFFDIDRGASVNIGGDTAGVIPSQQFEAMVERVEVERDYEAGARRIVEALENSTDLRAELSVFPQSERLIAAVSDWLQS